MTTENIRFPALDEIEARRNELATEARAILARSADGFADGDGERVDAINAELEALQARQQEMQKQADRIRRFASNPNAIERVDTSYGINPTPARLDDRGEALRLIERSAKTGHLLDHAAEKATTLIERSATKRDQSLAVRWVLAAGDDNYRSAFAKLLADPTTGHRLWDAAEQNAYRRAAEIHAEMRAMAVGTDSAGGALVPLTLDPSVNLTNDGSINPLRRIARVEQTATDSWKGITSAGATSEWKAEAAEAADGSPVLADKVIPVHFGDSFVPYSYEVSMDALDFLNELRKVLLDSAEQMMATAYTTGTGTGQPKGIITALAGTASEVAAASDGAYVADDVYSVQNALPARWSARAQWCAPLSIINATRQFETTNGAKEFPELANGQLLGRGMNELSNMDATLDAAANNYVLLYGDYSQFVIVDRIGTSLELIPNILGPNGRPTAQRGAMLWFRTGSDVLVPQAFRLLNV